MGHLREGRELDVTVEPVTLALDAVDVPAVHARPDGMPRAGRRAPPRHRRAAAALRRHGPPARDARPRGVRGRAVRRHPAEERGATIEAAVRRSSKDLDDHQQLEMLSSAADLLVVEDGVSRVCVLGFCMGGLYAFKAAASDRFDAAVVVLRHAAHARRLSRARATRSSRSRSPTQMCPTLAIFGVGRPVDAGRRHRRVARRVERSLRLRDRRGRGRRPRLRARSRSPGAPRRPTPPRAGTGRSTGCCRADPSRLRSS